MMPVGSFRSVLQNIRTLSKNQAYVEYIFMMMFLRFLNFLSVLFVFFKVLIYKNQVMLYSSHKISEKILTVKIYNPKSLLTQIALLS